VLNVLTNAIDAAAENEPPGQVGVETRYAADDRRVCVVVEDDGPGIPPDQKERLFRPFASSKGGHGTGLGLPVSQKILAEHGGQILVDSSPDNGSRFTLEMPAVSPDSAQQTSLS